MAQDDEFCFRVTETQRFIANAAMNALRDESTTDDQLVEHFTRMVVLIQKSGLGSYFANGLEWSFRSRSQFEPQQVEAEQFVLNDVIDRFNEAVDTARGRAASRIRWNRTRRKRAAQREIAAEMALLEEEYEQRRRSLQAVQAVLH